jgi:acetyl-CoA carboxylase carboxyl transferase subunit alpha
VIDNIDTRIAFRGAQSLLSRGTFALESPTELERAFLWTGKGIDGAVYSKFGAGLSVTLVPFVALGRIVAGVTPIPAAQLEELFASFATPLLPVIVVGHQKGRDTKQRSYRNFGMPKPEGYRKALRVMKLGEKFGRPIFTFIDTPGAYPGIDAEERGQAEAIAYNLREMAKIKVPIIVTVIGEGGSGGALAIGIGDQVLMLENATYSVISPEGCAAILWKDSSQAARAAEGLRLTAQHLFDEGIVDKIIPEPEGGAHHDYDQTARYLDSALSERLAEAVSCSQEDRLSRRYQKLRGFGRWGTEPQKGT